jgi:hypothetical protein
VLRLVIGVKVDVRCMGVAVVGIGVEVEPEVGLAFGVSAQADVRRRKTAATIRQLTFRIRRDRSPGLWVVP